nr:MAG TPA: hypothetical protein [Caudoviricetes sp.]
MKTIKLGYEGDETVLLQQASVSTTAWNRHEE